MKADTFREAKHLLSEKERVEANKQRSDLIIKKGIQESIDIYGSAYLKIDTGKSDSFMTVLLDHDEAVQVFNFISEMCAKKAEILQQQFDEL